MMDSKCKNCNQFIGEADKFCRFCGCPNDAYEKNQKEILIEEEKKSKKTLRQLEDDIQFSKSFISKEEIAEGKFFECDKIQLKRKGEKHAMRNRSILVLVAAIVGFVGCIIGYYVILSQKQWNITARFVAMTAIMLTLLFLAVIMLERVYNIIELGKVTEGGFVTRKMSFAKTPQVLVAGTVFDVVIVEKVCPLCSGEIKGDLHLEKINNNYVAVCNYDRKHFWNIPVAKFLSQYTAQESTAMTVDRREILLNKEVEIKAEDGMRTEESLKTVQELKDDAKVYVAISDKDFAKRLAVDGEELIDKEDKSLRAENKSTK